ncbi:erg-28 [Pristionchus pacificus]|uniref:Erg-28 n=1 Tax=Pristionchus pacificus TaxID=54126 RepID=A0A454XZX6_PRIPA|nr:erg-28 [Pristionchus pacificus]|eukprot:PDM68540.1 erg-28 [Pristionchus pacificus]
MASGSTVEKYLKGWTAFNILQLLGPIFLGYGKPATLAEQILPGAAAIHMRSHAYAAALMLIVKLAMLCCFSSRPMHVVHLLASLVSACSLSAELFIYKVMPLNTSNMFNLGLAVINVLLWSVCWTSMCMPEEPERKGPRRLFAKHYMEGNTFGVEDIENEKRRRKDKNM